MAAYAPMGVAGDVLAVVDGVRSTLEMTPTDVADIADGLTRIMAAYDKMGIYSFNMNLFTGAAGDDFARLPCFFSPRTFSTRPWARRTSVPCAICSMKRCAWPFRRKSTRQLREDFV